MTARHAFTIVGCGYVGARLAGRLDGTVRAVTGSPAGAARLRGQGIDAAAWDLDADSVAPLDVHGQRVFYLVPPPPAGRDPRVRRALAALAGRPARFVYLSTTGVYGDAAGATVTEDTPVNPTTARAQARADAELTVRGHCESHGIPWVVLRVPGIYGPGRLPLERLRRGDPAVAEAEAGPGNRIHVDDLVEICVAAATAPVAQNRVYNVGDGNHASSTAFFRTVARLAGLPPPRELPREQARRQMSAATWSFLGESRRVSTQRMREELGVALRYADLEDGVRASLEQGSDPGHFRT